MIRIIKRYLPLGLLAAITSCANDPATNDDNLPQGYSRITLSLCAEPQLSTRAPRWSDANAEDGEMMKSALVIMCDDANLVKRIIPVDMDGALYERHSVATVAAENGTYTFYSFGNIDYTTTDKDGQYTSATINGLTFTLDTTVPSALETSTWQVEFNNFPIPADPNAEDYKGIPMTNKEEHLVNSTRSITLHLFRMLSKVSFEFTNNTGGEIAIKNVELDQVTPDGTLVYLLPPKEGENIVNRFPTDFTNGKLTVYHDEADGLKVPVKAPGSEPVKHTVYFNESASQHVTHQMPLTITMERKDGSGKATDIRYALMSLTNIPRNSYVVVPVSLTDYMLELKAFFYPPIGGYPPYKLETKDEEFYCTFSTGGDFVLRPFVYRYEDRNSPEAWFELTDATKVQGYDLTVTDNAGIFSTAPYFEAGEILGTLNGTKGTASIRLSVRLLTATPGAIQEYNRTIYIIVE